MTLVEARGLLLAGGESARRREAALRVATYVRVGRLDRREPSNLQRRQLRLYSYLSAHTRLESVRAYHDVGRRDTGRPGLNRLLQDVQEERFDIMLIEDRPTRPRTAAASPDPAISARPRRRGEGAPALLATSCLGRSAGHCSYRRDLAFSVRVATYTRISTDTEHPVCPRRRSIPSRCQRQ